MKAPLKNASEVEALFARVDAMQNPAQYKLMLLLTYKLGLRPKEIALCQCSWFQGREIRIPNGHSKGKGGHASLPYNDEVASALEAHLRGRNRGPVFFNQQGHDFTAQGVSDALRRLYREAGQQGSAYCGRRTFATRMVDEGVNLLVVSKALRHRSVATTAEYVGVTDAMLRRAMFA